MSTYQKYLDNYTRGYIGFNTIAVLVQSCLGSVAAMYILHHGTSVQQMVQLFLVVIACMGFNAAVLSQQKPKTVFNMLIGSVAVSILLIIANIFFIH